MRLLCLQMMTLQRLTGYKKQMLYKKHTLILPLKSHLIRKQFRSDFLKSTFFTVLQLQIGQCCNTVFHSNQAKLHRYQLISSCKPIQLYLYNYVTRKNPFTKLYGIPFPYMVIKIAAGFCCYFYGLYRLH